MHRRKVIEEKRIGRPEKKIYSQSEMEKIIESYLNDETREISWLDEDEYKKAVFQFKSNLNAAMEEAQLKMYGLKSSCEDVLEIATKLCEDFGLRVRGIDQPISIEIIKQSRKFIIVSDGEEVKEKEADKREDNIGLNCPDCIKDGITIALIFSEGCFHCPNCGYSKC